MKCLSLWQPWATLVAIGAKTLETRSWETMYRGELAIHAAQAWNRKLADIALDGFFLSALQPLVGLSGGAKKLRNVLPFGAIVCTANLVDCYRIDPIKRPLDERELAFGDYTTGRFAWVLEDVRAFAKPIPFKGRQGLFAVPASLLKTLEKSA